MKFIPWITAFVLAMAIGTAAPSLAAPRQLLGKHILLRENLTIVVQPIAGGQPVTGKQSQERIIYISNVGRIFARMNTSNGDVSAVREQSPGNTPLDDVTYRWQGSALVGTSTAVLSTISFDAAYRTCAVSLVLRPHATAWDVNHKQWRILSSNADNVTCTIQDGNPFAGQ